MRWICAWMMVLGLYAQAVWSCSVPVFRYALERWESDYYPVDLVCTGALTAAEGAAAGVLTNLTDEGFPPANVYARIITTNAAAVPEGARIVVRYPRPFLTEVWSGALTRANAERVMDSPVRRELVRRVLGGDSAVWLLVASGDKARDDAAEKLLNEKLKLVETSLALPEITEEDRQAILAAGEGPPLKVAFSTIRIARDDAREAFLLHNLVGVGNELADSKDPLAFAVIGRGRALPPLIGEQICPELIEEVCMYVVGECSCEIKAQNIGFDMLVKAEWDKAIADMLYAEYDVPELVGVTPPVVTGGMPQADGAAEAAFESGGTGTVAASGGGTNAASSSLSAAQAASAAGVRHGSPIVRNSLFALGAAVLAVAAASVFMRRK